MATSSVSAAGLRIVRLLIGNPPQSVAELTRSSGVTRTAITEQLSELMAAGYVARTVDRATGRGRPRHRYAPTEAALHLVSATPQHPLGPAIFRALHELVGRELTDKVLSRVSLDLAEHYRTKVQGQTPRERLVELAQILADQGVLIDLTQDSGRTILRQRNCPYVDLVDEGRCACRVEQQMMSAVVGANLECTACRLDGCPSCVFELEPQLAADRS